MHYDKEEEEKKGRGKNKYKVRALVAMPLTYLQKRKKRRGSSIEQSKRIVFMCKEKKLNGKETQMCVVLIDDLHYTLCIVIVHMLLLLNENRNTWLQFTYSERRFIFGS